MDIAVDVCGQKAVVQVDASGTVGMLREAVATSYGFSPARVGLTLGGAEGTHLTDDTVLLADLTSMEDVRADLCGPPTTCVMTRHTENPVAVALSQDGRVYVAHPLAWVRYSGTLSEADFTVPVTESIAAILLCEMEETLFTDHTHGPLMQWCAATGAALRMLATPTPRRPLTLFHTGGLIAATYTSIPAEGDGGCPPCSPPASCALFTAASGGGDPPQQGDGQPTGQHPFTVIQSSIHVANICQTQAALRAAPDSCGAGRHIFAYLDATCVRVKVLSIRHGGAGGEEGEGEEYGEVGAPAVAEAPPSPSSSAVAAVEVHDIECPTSVALLALSHDGRFLLGHGGSLYYAWDTATGAMRQRIRTASHSGSLLFAEEALVASADSFLHITSMYVLHLVMEGGTIQNVTQSPSSGLGTLNESGTQLFSLKGGTRSPCVSIVGLSEDRKEFRLQGAVPVSAYDVLVHPIFVSRSGNTWAYYDGGILNVYQ